MKECIVHFKVIRGKQTKMLRGLIIMSDGNKPGIDDFIRTFRGMGYKVALENERELIFASIEGSEPYKLDITKIEIVGETEEKSAHDGELHSIVDHLIKKGW